MLCDCYSVFCPGFQSRLKRTLQMSSHADALLWHCFKPFCSTKLDSKRILICTDSSPFAMGAIAKERHCFQNGSDTLRSWQRTSQCAQTQVALLNVPSLAQVAPYHVAVSSQRLLAHRGTGYWHAAENRSFLGMVRLWVSIYQDEGQTNNWQVNIPTESLIVFNSTSWLINHILYTIWDFRLSALMGGTGYKDSRQVRIEPYGMAINKPYIDHIHYHIMRSFLGCFFVTCWWPRDVFGHHHFVEGRGFLNSHTRWGCVPPGSRVGSLDVEIYSFFRWYWTVNHPPTISKECSLTMVGTQVISCEMLWTALHSFAMECQAIILYINELDFGEYAFVNVLLSSGHHPLAMFTLINACLLQRGYG